MINLKNQLITYIKILAVFFVVIIMISGCEKNTENNTSRQMQVNIEKGDLFSQEDIISGIDDENLGLPLSCAERNSKVFILDIYSTDGLIKVFNNKNKKFLYKFAQLKSPKSQPIDIAVDNDISYIADIGTKKVYKYKKAKFVGEIQPEENFFPRSIDTDSKGNLVVLSFDKIFIISPEGDVINKFGKSGENEGELGAIGSEFYIGPCGICVDKNDNIYVADTLNYRIQEFTKEGKFIRQIPIGDAPNDIVVSHDKIYIATSQNLLMYSIDGDFIEEFELDKNLQDNGDFVSIGKGSSGKVLVLMANQRKLITLSKNNKMQIYEDKLSDRSFVYPSKLAVENDKIVAITEDQNKPLDIEYKVIALNNRGELLEKLQLKNHQEFTNPQDLTIIKDNIYLLDLYKIHQFNKDFKHVSSFGRLGSGPGEFGLFENYGILHGPISIIRGPKDRFMVSDTINDRVQIFSHKGKYIDEFKVTDPGPMGFYEKDDKIYILSSTDSLINVYTSEGKFIESFEIDHEKDNYIQDNFMEILENQWLTIDNSRGYMYISDANSHKIKVFDLNGKLIKTVGGFDTKRKGFYHPKGIFVDRDGFLWIADSGNHRIVKIKI